MKLAIEVIGWIGATLIVGAYALLSAGKLEGDSRTYHLMNIFGAVGFVVNSGWNGAYPSAALAAPTAQERRAGPLAVPRVPPPGDTLQAISGLPGSCDGRGSRMTALCEPIGYK